MTVSNKKIKRVIESVTGGDWVNDASPLQVNPTLSFFNPLVNHEEFFKLHKKYHSTVSITAAQMKGE